MWELKLIFAKCFKWCMSETYTLYKNQQKKFLKKSSSSFYACSVPQSCPALCDTKDWSLPGSSAHGIFLARILEWVAISSSRESSWPRDRTHISYVSCIAGRFFTTEPLGKQLFLAINLLKWSAIIFQTHLNIKIIPIEIRVETFQGYSDSMLSQIINLILIMAEWPERPVCPTLCRALYNCWY